MHRVDEPQTLDAELFQAVLIEMVRTGLLPQDVLDRVQQRFETEAEALSGSSRSQRYATLARMAGEIGMMATAASSSEWHAEQRRRQMRLRTAHIADGGNGG